MLITSVIVVAVILFVFLGGTYFGGHKVAINVNVKISQLSKLREMNCIYEEWIKFENNGNYIVDYLNKKKYKKCSCLWWNCNGRVSYWKNKK